VPGDIEAYLRARKEFENVANEVEQLGESILKLGEQLSADPTNVEFEESEWKSAQEIRAILARYNAAMKQMNHWWDTVPRNLRSGLKPPIGSAEDIIDEWADDDD
jgi:hypothetical protein